MTEMFGEAWSPMSVPDLAPDDDEVARSREKFSDFEDFELRSLLLPIVGYSL